MTHSVYRPHTDNFHRFPHHDILLHLPLLPDGTLVEGKLLALKDVTINTTTLARSAGNECVKTTSLELFLKSSVDLATSGHSLGLLGLDALALLLLLLLTSLLSAAANVGAVVCLVPLSERSSVDLDDSGAGQGVGADEFVVRWVESDGNHAGLAADALGSPGEVARVDAEGAELAVTTTGADEMDTLGSNSRVGRLATLLECSVCQMSEVF